MTPDNMPARTRSRIANGSVFIDHVDGRSALARRFRDVLGQLISDAGGDPSQAQDLLMRRASTLAVWCDIAESKMVRGDEDLPVERYCLAVNAMRRLLADLGIRREPRDISPTLEAYTESLST
jgi:hypothetical protein